MSTEVITPLEEMHLVYMVFGFEPCLSGFGLESPEGCKAGYAASDNCDSGWHGLVSWNVVGMGSVAAYGFICSSAAMEGGIKEYGETQHDYLLGISRSELRDQYRSGSDVTGQMGWSPVIPPNSLSTVSVSMSCRVAR